MACRTPVPDALDAIRRGADRVVEVSDDEIEDAMRALFADTHNVAEGAGAAALAAVLRERGRLTGRPVGVVLSGANVDAPLFGRILLSD
jgi:threonine dehydratase